MRADQAGAAGRDMAVGRRRICRRLGFRRRYPPAIANAPFYGIKLLRRLRGQAAGFVDRQQAVVVEKYFQI